MRPRHACALAALIVAAIIGDLHAQSSPALFPITVDDKHGMIDRTGKVVIPPEYSEPVIFRDGLARVAKGSKVAYLDAAGRFVPGPQDVAREPFSEGVTPAARSSSPRRWAGLPRLPCATTGSGGPPKMALLVPRCPAGAKRTVSG